jgi:hypothetical protein
LYLQSTTRWNEFLPFSFIAYEHYYHTDNHYINYVVHIAVFCILTLHSCVSSYKTIQCQNTKKAAGWRSWVGPSWWMIWWRKWAPWLANEYRQLRAKKNFTCEITYFISVQWILSVMNFTCLLLFKGKLCWLSRKWNYRVSSLAIHTKLKLWLNSLSLSLSHTHTHTHTWDETAIVYKAYFRWSQTPDF